MNALAQAIGIVPQRSLPQPRQIPLRDVGFDEDYQRDVTSVRVQRIIREWDPTRCDAIKVSHRGGRLYCFDGRHRVEAMRGLGISTWWAHVYEGMSKKDEARAFVLGQRDRAGLVAWDLFKADTTRGEAAVLSMIDIARQCGFDLKRRNGPNHITAIGAIRRIHALGGDKLLEFTLQSMAKLWPGSRSDPKSLARQGIVIEGLATFFHSSRDEPQYERTRTERVLERNSPVVFIQKSQEIARQRFRSNSSPVMVAEAIRDYYNVGLKREKKLSAIRVGALKRRSTQRKTA